MPSSEKATLHADNDPSNSRVISAVTHEVLLLPSPPLPSLAQADEIDAYSLTMLHAEATQIIGMEK